MQTAQRKKLIMIVAGVGLLSLLLIVSILSRRQFTFRSRADTAPGILMRFNPPQVTAAQNGEFTTTIVGKAVSDAPIQGYAFGLNFDKSKIEVTDITYKAGAVSAGIGDDNTSLAAANTRGYIKIQGEVTTAEGKLFSASSDTDIVSLKFKAKTTDPNLVVLGSAVPAQFFKISSTSDLSPVLASLDQLAINPGSSNSTTPGQGASFNINFKLKFQGVTKKPDDKFNKLTVKIAAVSATNEKKEGTGDFTADASGVWSGKVGFNGLTAGQGYKFLVKGPKHIQRKVCDATPSENEAGTYICKLNNRITISNDMTLNFSGIYMMAGDVPNQDNIQDGYVDAYDLSVIRNNLSKKDDNALRQCDLNLDGICDTQDFGLAIRALSIKTDEED